MIIKIIKDKRTVRDRIDWDHCIITPGGWAFIVNYNHVQDYGRKLNLIPLLVSIISVRINVVITTGMNIEYYHYILPFHIIIIRP